MRPAKEACGERIGFLPGDLSEKMAPWAAPIFDNMEVFIDKTQIRNLLWEDRIEVIPLAFARGRSLNNAFIIVDEAQNVSPEQMLMVLTRLGKNSKMAINGDLAQTDVRGASGLYDAMMRLQGVDGIGFHKMVASDIVRHPLIAKILERYIEEDPVENPPQA
jgi:phosphate starvation-inducible PhoH-like protein